MKTIPHGCACSRIMIICQRWFNAEECSRASDREGCVMIDVRHKIDVLPVIVDLHKRATPRNRDHRWWLFRTTPRVMIDSLIMNLYWFSLHTFTYQSTIDYVFSGFLYFIFIYNSCISESNWFIFNSISCIIYLCKTIASIFRLF